MTTFVENYLATVDDDPETAFDLLTPDYQVESDGLAGYENFWGNVINVRVESIEADVENLTVTYTYTYNLTRRAATQTDTVLHAARADRRRLPDRRRRDDWLTCDRGTGLGTCEEAP